NAFCAEKPERDLPATMHDPYGVLPDAEAEKVLRGWLDFDDWYVQAIAVIRLKTMGVELRPPELKKFFTLAGAAGDRPLLRRALELLQPSEACDGAIVLLNAGCDWALPWAVRFNSPEATQWLNARIAAIADSNDEPY